MDTENSLKKLNDILIIAGKKGASDIHIAPETQIMLRVDGKMVRMSEDKVTSSEVDELIKPMLDSVGQEILVRTGETESAFTVPGLNRLRVSVFRQRGTYAAQLRLLPLEIPEPGELKIPEAVVGLTNCRQGLVIVSGPAGSGKTTTLAALVSVIAKRDAKTIITLEKPVEYLLQHHTSMVLQREIGSDSMSFASGLLAAVRQDPDVIVVGEICDYETMRIALNAAETGHLVFCAMHTNSVSASIDRIIGAFPPYQQQQTRVQLSEVLEGIIVQQLIPKQNAAGRIAAFEVLLANPAVRSLIREGKSYQLPTVLRTGQREGMQTMDDAIYDMYMKSCISSDAAVSCSQDPEGMRQKVQLF